MSQTVFITGCSSGIGRETAMHFQREGWNVAATMRNPEAGEELGALERVGVFRLDVTNSASIEAAVDAALERFGAIDVLVNNAGYGAYGPLEVTPREKMQRQLETNVIGLLETTKAVLPHFRSRKAGTVVNISSAGGLSAGPLGALYYASKFAVEGLSESLCFELAAIGVRVKVVEPGLVATDFNSRSIDISNEPAIEEYQPVIRAMVSGTSAVTGGTGGEAYRATPDVTAADIFAAATDGSDRLRFPSGEDAKASAEILRSKGSEEHLRSKLEAFGLGARSE